jgi:preprotein translocase subunit SecA
MSKLAAQYQLTTIKHQKKIPAGLDGVLYRLAGRWRSRSGVSRRLMRDAEAVQGRKDKHRDASNRALKERLCAFQGEFKRKTAPENDLLFSALAAIGEAAFRTLGLNPYCVQTAGALALLNGYIAEMATGEGKTLTASLAAVVKGWSGRPCHIVTANDYLAQRDAEKLEPLYSFCGLSVGFVISASDPLLRKKGYAADITYSTAKEVAADFLRDRIALGSLQKFEQRLIRHVVTDLPLGSKDVVMRGLHTAFIDEADSLLIDEAVVPLIISREHKNEELNIACRTAFEASKKLSAGKDYILDYRHKDLHFDEKLDMQTVFSGLPMPVRFSGIGFMRELLRQALVAREFFHRDKQYVIQEKKVVIVDEFTGRVMPQRSWSDGLHQMIEVKEAVPVTPPNETLARISFQRFFRYYHFLAGMTGTAREEKGELWQVYDLPVIVIPRNRPCQSTLFPPLIFATRQEKLDSILKEISEVHRTGRPILVGTRSVELSERLAEDLRKAGLTCRVINAVRHKEEAAIVAEAGIHGAITVATNMVGRGTDIMLDMRSKKCGGLHVLATEYHESGRIDRQLYGRSGRQGDPGSSRTFAALDDELVVRYGSPLMRKIVRLLFSIHKTAGVRFAAVVVRAAQSLAQRKAAQSRIAIQKMDLWLDDSLSFTREDVR